MGSWRRLESILQQNAKGVTCMISAASYRPTDHRRPRLPLSARLQAQTRHAWDTLLWGSVVSSSTKSSSTTASSDQPPYSRTRASADHQTTQHLPRTRFTAVGPVSYRSYKSEGWVRLWLWVTLRPDRSWELRMGSQDLVL